jgi:hypothetical protein
MKFAKRFSFSVVLVVVLVPFLTAQQRTASSAAATTPGVSQSDAPDSRGHVFTAGSGDNSILYCVTDTGNITTIETPISHPMISSSEGYGLCQESPIVEYHDYAVSDSGNWQSPQIVSLTKSVIKISRTTSDGNWTLVQTISKVAATASIKVVIALTNNQSVDKVAYLLRFADIAHQPSTRSGASLESAWPGTRPLVAFTMACSCKIRASRHLVIGRVLYLSQTLDLMRVTSPQVASEAVLGTLPSYNR